MGDYDGAIDVYLSRKVGSPGTNFMVGVAHALAQVKRNTVFTYDAGRVVHEMHDPFGRTYVLMNTTYDLYLANTGTHVVVHRALA